MVLPSVFFIVVSAGRREGRARVRETEGPQGKKKKKRLSAVGRSVCSFLGRLVSRASERPRSPPRARLPACRDPPTPPTLYSFRDMRTVREREREREKGLTLDDGIFLDNILHLSVDAWNIRDVLPSKCIIYLGCKSGKICIENSVVKCRAELMI